MKLPEVVTRNYKSLDSVMLKGADATVKAWNYMTGKPKSTLANILLSASVASYSLSASVASYSHHLPLSISLPLLVSIPSLYLAGKTFNSNSQAEEKQHLASTRYFCINPFSKSVAESYAKVPPFLFVPVIFFSFRELAEPIANLGPKIAYGLADIASTSFLAASYVMRSKPNYSAKAKKSLEPQKAAQDEIKDTPTIAPPNKIINGNHKLKNGTRISPVLERIKTGY